MTTVLGLLVANLVSIACIVSATVLTMNGHWQMAIPMLILAFMFGHGIKGRDE